MKTSILSTLAAALVGGALGTLVTLSFARTETSLAADPDTAIHGRIVESAGPAADQRFRELEARLNRLSLVKPKEAPIAEDRRAASSLAATAELEARLAELEEELSRMKGQRGAPLPDAAQEQQGRRLAARMERKRLTFDDASSVILNGAKTDSEKVSAWAALRSAETWDDAVVSEMIAIGENNADPEIREDVWRQADGRASSTLLVGPLLRALQSDPEDGPRSEAAETLENYIDEPGVRAALIYASENDSSASVRKEARGALN